MVEHVSIVQAASIQLHVEVYSHACLCMVLVTLHEIIREMILVCGFNILLFFVYGM